VLQGVGEWSAAGGLPFHKGNKKIRLFEHEDNSKESFAILESK